MTITKYVFSKITEVRRRLEMKIVSWNVNGLRAVLKNRERSLKSFLDDLGADIICLQETKATKQGLDRGSCVADGYSSYFSFCRVKGGYSGVVTFCRSSVTPVRAEEGLTGSLVPPGSNDGVELGGDGHTHFTSKEDMLTFDGEGRAVLTEHICDCDNGSGGGGGVGGESEGENGGREEGRGRNEGDGGEGGRGRGGGKGNLVVINVYCPMVDRENVNAERLSYKMLFYSVLQDRCTSLERAGKRVVVTGDLNCSREAIDSAYIQDTPTLLHGSPEREWMKSFVTSQPLITLSSSLSSASPSLLLDTFRYLHPETTKAYTCWSTFLGYRKTNYGTRIDYVLCSQSLAPLLSQAEVWAEVTGSDHCPVMADFSSLSVSPSPREPSLSFHLLGRQTTLFSFVAPPTSTQPDGEPEVKISSITEATTTSREFGKKGVKRKGSELSSAAKTPRTLQSFFITTNSSVKTSPDTLPLETTENLSDLVSEKEIGGESLSTPLSSSSSSSSSSNSSSTTTSSSSSSSATNSQLKPEWSTLFSGPPKPPLCRRHREPATLRTVRKTGPTRGRKFWVCSRPAGSKSDPDTQCDFFQWLTAAPSTTVGSRTRGGSSGRGASKNKVT